MTALNMWHFYVYRGNALVPTVARTEAGFFLDQLPVEVIDLNSVEHLTRVLAERISHNNEIVSTPTRMSFPKPVVPQIARAKSSRQFDKEALIFTVYRDDHGYFFPRYVRREKGGWLESPDRPERMPASAPPTLVVNRLLEIMRSQLDSTQGTGTEAGPK